MYTKNAVTETAMGAVVQINEKQIELTRAAMRSVSHRTRISHQRLTFDKPLKLDFPCIKCSLDPPILPGEEFDEFDL